MLPDDLGDADRRDATRDVTLVARVFELVPDVIVAPRIGRDAVRMRAPRVEVLDDERPRDFYGELERSHEPKAHVEQANPALAVRLACGH